MRYKQIVPIIADADVFNGFGENGDVANGSFESKAPGNFNAFGWRYADDGVKRINDGTASHGAYYIQLSEKQEVHQGTDATGDFTRGKLAKDTLVEVTVDVRAAAPGAEAELFADAETQALYQRKNIATFSVQPAKEWQTVTQTFLVPAGSWKTYFGLRTTRGIVDFDNVRVSQKEEK